ncbi:MAG: N-acetylglucosaminyl-diphospho-decaprenol L-rhamnosyltransferase [Pseudonocardiales bacterium]|jgi:N-acetylglucosaminyl-diphospho-decaprenol L-rhamnosyltransferase|nr:N-acetylglucosaminyl-diphospho-decaprenol L-rhamnosyltransferase [Pseudonocardiales bacterium]
MTRASLSAVTVTYSPGDTLATFLDSLAKATTQQPVPVVIADNGSSDGAPEQAAGRDGVRLLSTGGNLGFGQAANQGVLATDSEWVLVANPDVVLQPGALDELLAASRRWPRAGALGPLIRTEDGRLYPSARALPSLGRGIGHALFGWWWPANPWTAAYRRDDDALTERRAGWLSGSCLLLRREAFDSVGGFDPRYFMYFEDVDLGERLGRAGWLNVYVPTAEVTHLGGHSTSRHRSEMLAEHHRSALLYLSGRYSGARWAPLRLALRIGLRARARLLETVQARRAT